MLSRTDLRLARDPRNLANPPIGGFAMRGLRGPYRASQAMQLQQLQFAEMAIKVSKKLKDDGLTTKEREEALVRLFNKRAHAQS